MNVRDEQAPDNVMTSAALTVCAMIPTYRRPRDLERCLKALAAQQRRADEVIVIVRDTDVETWDLLARFDATVSTLRNHRGCPNARKRERI